MRNTFEQLRGFNYQPSFGSSGLEIWQNFDPAVVHRELGRGKKYFPKMTAIRLWLSWDAFNRNPHQFCQNFESALKIAANYEFDVMPVLFNRWHDAVLDYGGVYVDHFLPGSSWIQTDKMWRPFLEQIVAQHASDERIFCWDLCNEPFSYLAPFDRYPMIEQAEYAWLAAIHRTCKELKATAPITVGLHVGYPSLTSIDAICDIFSIHPYALGPSLDFEKMLDGFADVAQKLGKPLIATETCWGSLSDADRVATMRYTLTQLKQRNIGWLAYLLHHSPIADAHRPEFGPTSGPGNLAFIEADGTLRPGHEAFNEF